MPAVRVEAALEHERQELPLGWLSNNNRRDAVRIRIGSGPHERRGDVPVLVRDGGGEWADSAGRVEVWVSVPLEEEGDDRRVPVLGGKAQRGAAVVRQHVDALLPEETDVQRVEVPRPCRFKPHSAAPQLRSLTASILRSRARPPPPHLQGVAYHRDGRTSDTRAVGDMFVG